jgi:intergrase/recombinase
MSFRAVDILHRSTTCSETIELLVKLDSANLNKERQAEKDAIGRGIFEDVINYYDVDYLRGHPANADSNTLKIIRVLIISRAIIKNPHVKKSDVKGEQLRKVLTNKVCACFYIIPFIL